MTVADQSQGVPLAMIQELARYWMTDYDWRTWEANLNSLPQFIAEIDGLDIHFIHVRSQDEDALPHGVDVADDGNGVLQDGRLYQLVRQHDAVRERTLEITSSNPAPRRTYSHSDSQRWRHA